MKTILVMTLLCAFVAPVLGALTDTDLDKIRLIIQEEIKPIKADIVTLKTDVAVVKAEVTNLKETVNNGFGDVQQDFGDVQQDFDTFQKNFDRQNNIIIACIGIPLAILAIGATIGGILAHRCSRKDETIEKQIETLTQEIETLKQQRIVNP